MTSVINEICRHRADRLITRPQPDTGILADLPVDISSLISHPWQLGIGGRGWGLVCVRGWRGGNRRLWLHGCPGLVFFLIQEPFT